MPCLNEGAVIADLLRDLQPLRAAGHELILVDGGSQDATLSLAVSQVDRVLSVAPGRAGQMNAGAAVATGEVLWFVHADTRLPLGAVDLLQTAFNGGAEWGRFDVRLDGRRRVFRLIERLMNWRSRLTGVATGDQAMFVTRAAFQAVGGFPPIPLMEDVALSKLLRRRGRPACIAQPVLTSSRRWQRHGVIATVLLMWRLRLAYFLGVSPQRLARQYRSCNSLTQES